MIVETIPQIESLSASEKMTLISEIWEGMKVDSEEVEISDELKAELDRRWEHYQANPDTAQPWEEVKKRLLNSRKK